MGWGGVWWGAAGGEGGEHGGEKSRRALAASRARILSALPATQNTLTL